MWARLLKSGMKFLYCLLGDDVLAKIVKGDIAYPSHIRSAFGTVASRRCCFVVLVLVCSLLTPVLMVVVTFVCSGLQQGGREPHFAAPAAEDVAAVSLTQHFAAVLLRCSTVLCVFSLGIVNGGTKLIKDHPWFKGSSWLSGHWSDISSELAFVQRRLQLGRPDQQENEGADHSENQEQPGHQQL
jgi:hypothetical protein